MKHIKHLKLFLKQVKIISGTLLPAILLIASCTGNRVVNEQVLKSVGDKQVIERPVQDTAVYINAKGLGISDKMAQARLNAQQNARKKLFDKISQNIKDGLSMKYKDFSREEKNIYYNFEYELINFILGNLERNLDYSENQSYQQVRQHLKDGTQETVYKYYVVIGVEKTEVRRLFDKGVEEYYFQFFPKNSRTDDFYRTLKQDGGISIIR